MYVAWVVFVIESLFRGHLMYINVGGDRVVRLNISLSDIVYLYYTWKLGKNLYKLHRMCLTFNISFKIERNSEPDHLNVE